MKIWTSYFYQIRFFSPDMIPVSTAIWDPKWYHDFKGQNYCFIDRNGVVNGLRCEALHPAKENNGCTECDKTHSKDCMFLKNYRKQLESVNPGKIIAGIEKIIPRLNKSGANIKEPEIVFIVYETPENPCSERAALQEWLRNSGYEVNEWVRK